MLAGLCGAEATGARNGSVGPEAPVVFPNKGMSRDGLDKAGMVTSGLGKMLVYLSKTSGRGGGDSYARGIESGISGPFSSPFSGSGGFSFAPGPG